MYDVEEILFCLCENVDEQRKKNHMSIMQLSKACHTSYSETHNWVTGARQPSLRSLLHVANACGITLEELIGARK